ncbi:MAG: TonB-dependent receptor [Cytophagales bacterium]|nr:TonB-dependent receptor [Rhizobacter sp.]
MRISVIWAALPVLGVTGPSWAQTSAPATLLDPVVVTAERTRQSSFDAPAAISVVSRDVIESGGLQVNLSEALNRVPGITVLNRQNYAQDLQLSIRGFGARSTFGVRGVRVIVDGIPATMPDGQGQASSIALSSVGRIEVLRGPMAQLYGNAAGGVVQVFTEDDAAQPTVTVTGGGGPYHQARLGLKYSTSTPGYGLTLDATRYQTDGYREHSAAERGQFNARWQSDLTRDTHMSVVVNALDQPRTQDPLGLTRADFEARPTYAVPLASSQDARKTVRQEQVGTVIEHRLNESTSFTGRLYVGERGLDNALSIPPAAQTAPTSSGGIVQFERVYAGGGAQLSHRVKLQDGLALRVTGGIEYDRMRENRQGFVNTGGVQGALKRDERNTVENRDAFAQASLDVHSQWTLTGGLRTINVRFRSQDNYIVGANPDDSGGVDYHAVNPVLGVTWRAAPELNVYLNAGRGFETPTFNELAYRNSGTGLNTDLRASRSNHMELGAKWKLGSAQRLDAALFGINTRDEILVDTNAGGRSTFKNAERTERRGVELSHVAQLSETLRSTLSLTALRARFESGKRLPGTPERSAFAELAWAPKAAWGGFNTGVEAVHTGTLFVNDANTDAAPAATVFNLRAGFAQELAGWRFTQLVRVDNASDHQYAGSVIVNDGNGRFFEPALPRTWVLAVTARYAF